MIDSINIIETAIVWVINFLIRVFWSDPELFLVLVVPILVISIYVYCRNRGIGVPAEKCQKCGKCCEDQDLPWEKSPIETYDNGQTGVYPFVKGTSFSPFPGNEWGWDRSDK